MHCIICTYNMHECMRESVCESVCVKTHVLEHVCGSAYIYGVIYSALTSCGWVDCRSG